MITADSVLDLILRITERFEDESECCIRRTMTEEIDDEEVDFVLDGEIETALNCLNIKNQVTAISIYDGMYAICVSFVIDDELCQRVIIAKKF